VPRGTTSSQLINAQGNIIEYRANPLHSSRYLPGASAVEAGSGGSRIRIRNGRNDEPQSFLSEDLGNEPQRSSISGIRSSIFSTCRRTGLPGGRKRRSGIRAFLTGRISGHNASWREQWLAGKLCGRRPPTPAPVNATQADWFPDLRTREIVYGAGVMVSSEDTGPSCKLARGPY